MIHSFNSSFALLHVGDQRAATCWPVMQLAAALFWWLFVKFPTTFPFKLIKQLLSCMLGIRVHTLFYCAEPFPYPSICPKWQSKLKTLYGVCFIPALVVDVNSLLFWRNADCITRIYWIYISRFLHLPFYQLFGKEGYSAGRWHPALNRCLRS